MSYGKLLSHSIQSSKCFHILPIEKNLSRKHQQEKDISLRLSGEGDSELRVRCLSPPSHVDTIPSRVSLQPQLNLFSSTPTSFPLPFLHVSTLEDRIASYAAVMPIASIFKSPCRDKSALTMLQMAEALFVLYKGSTVYSHLR